MRGPGHPGPAEGAARRRGGPGAGPGRDGVGGGGEAVSDDSFVSFFVFFFFFVSAGAGRQLLCRVHSLGQGLAARSLGSRSRPRRRRRSFSFRERFFALFFVFFFREEAEPLQRRREGPQSRPRAPLPEARGEGPLVGRGAQQGAGGPRGGDVPRGEALDDLEEEEKFSKEVHAFFGGRGCERWDKLVVVVAAVRPSQRSRRLDSMKIQLRDFPPPVSGLSPLTSRSVSMSRSRSVVEPSSAGAARGGGEWASSIVARQEREGEGDFPLHLSQRLCGLKRLSAAKKKREKKTNHFCFHLTLFFSLLEEKRRVGLATKELAFAPSSLEIASSFQFCETEQERGREETRQ